MGRTTVTALDDISLAVGRGEFVAVAGPSGSGKSTLLHLIGCLDRPTAGSIHIDGVDTSELKPAQFARLRRERIGFVFQTFNLIPVFTAVENVEYPAVDPRRSTAGPPPASAGGARGSGSRPARETPARSAVGWRAAARGGGPRDRPPAASRDRRRTNRQPRYPERHRSGRNHARPESRPRPDLSVFDARSPLARSRPAGHAAARRAAEWQSHGGCTCDSSCSSRLGTSFAIAGAR